MTQVYSKDGITIHNGNCLDALATLPSESVDSIVTDPPYGLSFMGKKWDYDVPSVDIWEQCLRVLKPGGHLLAFAGTRTQHRMAVRIEDAGFEIRDMIAWVYGSGFPKSLDVSKAIDKAAGAEREKIQVKPRPETSGTMSGKTDTRPWIEKSRELGYHEVDGNTPVTPEAQQWAGWGTALKPALEPITVARKPLCGTVAENVLTHGTGGINVDGCRVGTDGGTAKGNPPKDESNGIYGHGINGACDIIGKGRWPANLIHDGSEEVAGLFPEDGDASASRFFYCAKADAIERRNSKHPTVKPVALMRYLVRLVAPIGATVLDPFCGSGTTVEAAMLESCKAIGIELNPDYCADAIERLRQGVLF